MRIEDLLLTIFGAFLWGVAPIVHKFLLGNYNQITIMIMISLIYFLCLLCCLPFLYETVHKDLLKITVSDSVLFLFAGVVVLFLGNVIYYYVLKDNDSHIISALNSCAPFFTLLLALILLREKINIFGLLGTIFIVIGVIFISFNDHDINVTELFMLRR
jgi:drug/metabolite transporter (DMT)-like permease